jgi:type VI secretion system secreted protein VgrG
MSIPVALRPFMLSRPAEVPELAVLSIDGEEAVSRLFRFRLVVTSAAPVSFADALGRTYSLDIEIDPGHKRRITGLVVAIRELGRDEHHHYRYRLELVPQAWPLTQTVRSRIFQDATALSIVEDVLRTTQGPWSVHCDPGIAFRQRPYCVQYFESDYDFAMRLMEEEGCFYFFTQEGLRIGNSAVSATADLPSPTVRMREVVGGPGESISRWRRKRRVATYRYRLRDQHFQLANPFLEGDADLGQVPAGTPGWEPLKAGLAPELTEYPGDYAHLFDELSNNGGQREDGLSGYIDCGYDKASLRLMQQVAGASVIEAASNCSRLFPGSRFTLQGEAAEQGGYLVLSVRHHGTQAIEHSSGGARGFSYRNTFTCIPVSAALFFRPPRTTRKPVVNGCQTALVIGPDSEEIWTDKYGRVRVKFPWDTGTLGSCWVRTGTAWAGSQWGSLHVPRIGQEVIVSFLDGDPDRPIIVGSVYNARNMPCYDLPSGKRQSGIVSRSTPKGEAPGFNEIRFDDTDGSEQLIVHAQNDQFNVVENDSHTIVRGDRMAQIDGSHFVAIGENRHETVGTTVTVEAGEEIHLKAKKIVIEAEQISLRTSAGGGKEFLYLEKGGGITIDSKGSRVWLNCGGAKAPDDGTKAEPVPPQDPYESGSES